MAAHCLGIRPPGDNHDHVDDYDDDGDNDDSNDYNDNDDHDKSQEKLPHSCCYSTTKGDLFISFEHVMMISRPNFQDFLIEAEKSDCLKIQAIFSLFLQKCKILPDQMCAPLGARHPVGLADKT